MSGVPLFHRYPLAMTVLSLAVLGPARSMAQCGPNVPTVQVDLSSAPNATFQTPNIQRQGQCCGATAPDQCLQFVITLHPDAQGINFDICAGAVPPGALFYQIACGPPIQVGQPICLNGPGPHVLTFCKPGNNTNQYCITSVPAPSAGPGLVLNDGCTGTLTSSGFAAGSIQWTSVFPGAQGAFNGYLACATCANTTVTGQTGAPGHVDYQVCGYAIAPCSSLQFCDTVRVYFNPTLTVAIEPLMPTVCFGAAGTTITAVGGGGTPPYSFQWNTGATTASIFVGPGTYSVLMSDASDCPPTSTQVVVTQFAQPIQALPGDDIVVCGQSAAVQLNGSVTGASGGEWSGGNGSFDPVSTSLNAIYTPTAAEIASGSVQLLLTTTGNGTCPGDSAPLTITFAAPFTTVGITSANATCSDAANGSVAVSPVGAGWSYAWSHDAGLNAPYAGSLTAGAYTVIITDPSGCDTTLTATVSAPDAITIAGVSSTPESCAGLGDGSATVIAQGGTPPYQYTWSNGQQSQTIAVGAGSWSVSVSDAQGCAPAVATVVVDVLGQPNIANAGQDQTACLNTFPVPLNGAVVNATGGTWSGGGGMFIGNWPTVSYQPSADEVLSGGLYLVLTTTGNGTCPAGVDSMYLSLSNAFLSASLTATDVLCHGGATGSATFLPAGPSLTFQWSAPGMGGSNQATGLAAGMYAITVTDVLGCDTSLQVMIGEPPPLVVVLSASADPLCNGGQNGQVTVQANGGTAPYSHVWNGTAAGQNSPQAVGLAAGPFAVVVTDASGCQATVAGQLGEPPPIQLSANVPDTVCVNSPVTLSATSTGGTGPHTISWSGLGTGPTVVHAFTASQTVTVTVADANGCPGPVSVFTVNVLDLSQATLLTSNDTVVCPGGQAVVGAQLMGYTGAYTMTWPGLGLSGPGPFTIPVQGSDSIPVVVTDACGQVLTGMIVASVDVVPVISLPPVLAEGCAPLTVTLSIPDPGVPVTWQWNLPPVGNSISPAPILTYSNAGQYPVGLTVITAAGCTSSVATPGMVVVHPRPVAGFEADPWITDIDHASIAFTNLSGAGITATSWTFGDGGGSDVVNPVHTYSDVGVFPVELWVMNTHGCVDSTVHVVRITPVYDITIPNAFTPDANGGGGMWIPGDLSNDVFYPFVRFVDDFRMRIFNRWGELIFESHDPSFGWDGNYRGQMSPQDVYVYQVWVRFVDGKEDLRLGDVTLLR